MFLNATMVTNTECVTNGTQELNRTEENAACNQLQQQDAHINALLVPAEARICLICFYVTIFLLGITGNAVVCWVIGMKKQLSGSDMFVVALAFTDLLASASVPILSIHDLLANLRWYLGSVMCKVLPSMSSITLLVSSWLQVLIAADRRRAIVTPMKRRSSTITKLCGVICTWTIAIGLYVPFMLLLEQRKHKGEYFCWINYQVLSQRFVGYYTILLDAFRWVIPISAIAVLYGLCVRKLREYSFSNDNNHTMRRRIIENKKVIRMFILIAALFCICTLPHALLNTTYNLLQAFKGSAFDSEVVWTLNSYLFAFSTISSCINLLIYSKRQPEIKEFVKKALKKTVL